MTQDKIIKMIIGSEKGVNRNEPESVGGISVDGVSKILYDTLLPELRRTMSDVPTNIEEIENRPDIINQCYIINLGIAHVWELPEFLQYIYSDFYTNAQSVAVKIIQRFIEVEDDGIWGTGTSRAVLEWKKSVEHELETDPHVDNEIITKFHEEKLAHYQRLVNKNPDKFKEWHNGWKRRANHVLAELQEYFEVDEPTPSAADDDDIIVEKPPERTSELDSYGNDEFLRQLVKRIDSGRLK